jgi:predicted nuclease of predicted toxin-antitoxin system
LLADLNIAPRTVAFLRSLGHDVVRVDQALPPGADDASIVVSARQDDRVILTQISTSRLSLHSQDNRLRL